MYTCSNINGLYTCNNITDPSEHNGTYWRVFAWFVVYVWGQPIVVLGGGGGALYIGVLAIEWISGAPPLFGISFTFDVVERMRLQPQLCSDL